MLYSISPNVANTSTLIDIGPFLDRFGSLKIPIMSSDDPTIRAIMQDLSVRKWIDLSKPEVLQSMLYISTLFPALNEEKRNEIINTPVSEIENLALRKMYF